MFIGLLLLKIQFLIFKPNYYLGISMWSCTKPNLILSILAYPYLRKDDQLGLIENADKRYIAIME